MIAILRRFFFVAVACVAAYVLLHVLRAFGVDPEARGIWAGATGYMLGDLALTAINRHPARKQASWRKRS